MSGTLPIFVHKKWTWKKLEYRLNNTNYDYYNLTNENYDGETGFNHLLSDSQSFNCCVGAVDRVCCKSSQRKTLIQRGSFNVSNSCREMEIYCAEPQNFKIADTKYSTWTEQP
eukprot:UN18105